MLEGLVWAKVRQHNRFLSDTASAFLPTCKDLANDLDVTLCIVWRQRYRLLRLLEIVRLAARSLLCVSKGRNAPFVAHSGLRTEARRVAIPPWGRVSNTPYWRRRLRVRSMLHMASQGGARPLDRCGYDVICFARPAGQPCRTRIQADMAYDEWEHEYHLTPNGWLPGSLHFRGTLAKKVPVPIDRVMTMVQENLKSSSSPLLQTTWRPGWQSSGHSQEKIDHLLMRFGRRPPEAILFRLDQSKGSVPTSRS